MRLVWPGNNKQTYQAPSYKVREVLGLPKRLDMNQLKPIFKTWKEPHTIQSTLIKILPPSSTKTERFKHRILGRCWQCDMYIPVGRFEQHYRCH
jgi:hypothetical protein